MDEPSDDIGNLEVGAWQYVILSTLFVLSELILLL